MTRIRPEWLVYSPDDFSGLAIHDLMCQAGSFARQWREFWVVMYTQDVVADQEEVDLLERLHHAFTVALMCRKNEFLSEIRRLDVPVGNIDSKENIMLAASLYERRANP